MTRYKIVPMNEPNGEGNGWYDCADDAPGVHFMVEWDNALIEDFPTRRMAERFLKARGVIA